MESVTHIENLLVSLTETCRRVRKTGIQFGFSIKSIIVEQFTFY